MGTLQEAILGITMTSDSKTNLFETEAAKHWLSQFAKMDIDAAKIDTIPEYVIKECDNIMKEAQ